MDDSKQRYRHVYEEIVQLQGAIHVGDSHGEYCVENAIPDRFSDRKLIEDSDVTKFYK